MNILHQAPNPIQESDILLTGNSNERTTHFTTPASGNQPLSPLAKAAIRYAAVHGLHVHPLKANAKTPATDNGLKDASNDDTQVEKLWAGCPQFNIGLNCGASDLVALDFDIHKPEFAGGDLLAQLMSDYPTAASETQSGGYHLLFRQPEGVKFGNSRGNLPFGVDVRGHGGYIVLPPSKLDPELIDADKPDSPEREVKRNLYRQRPGYQWVQGRSPSEIEIAELPAFVLDLIQAKSTAATVAPAAAHTNGNFSRYAEVALNGEIDKLLTTPEGERNDQLNKSGFALGQLIGAGVLNESTVTDHLQAAAHVIGLTEGESGKTIQSGLAAGKSKPRQIPERPQLRDVEQYPRIVVNRRQDRDILSDAQNVIREINESNSTHPVLFVRAGILSQVATDENGVHFIRNAEGAILASTLVRHVDWLKQCRDKEGNPFFEAVPVPERIVRMLEVTTDWTHVQALEGIALAPTFAADGTLHTELGYNSATKLYNAGNIQVGDTEPTEANLAEAKRLIMEELFGEFPFVDEASKAHSLALLILPFVRPMINGATPNHLFDAPTPGTGKSLLADLCTIPFANGVKSTISLTKSEDEFSKGIITALLSGRSFVCIDNLPQSATLDSAKLASALTESEISDRTMKTHAAMTIRPRCGWITTGNNTKLSTELARRTIRIRLDRNSEKPWEVTGFRHSDIKAWALEHRSELATAAITIIRKWLADGRPKFAGKTKGSFSAWTQTIGGILQAADIPGFLENEQAFFEDSVSENTDLWRSFVSAWYSQYRDLSVKIGDLFKLASHPDNKDSGDNEEWLGLLDEELQGLPEAGRRRRFGRQVEDKRDSVIGNYKITKGKVRDGSTTWHLRQVG